MTTLTQNIQARDIGLPKSQMNVTYLYIFLLKQTQLTISQLKASTKTHIIVPKTVISHSLKVTLEISHGPIPRLIIIR